MGKISDAMEKSKNENLIKLERSNKKQFDSQVRKANKPLPANEIYPAYDCSPKLVTCSAPDSDFAEKFKLLRTRILFNNDRERPKTIMVTSALPNEGKTFVSANLAVSLSLGIDEHVLLVDCDLRKPHLHEILGYKNTAGLHEYLTGKDELQNLIIRTKVNKLSLLTAGKAAVNPSELLSSTMMDDFLKEVKHRYEDRFIVIDSTPCQATAEAKALAKCADAVVLVVKASKSPRKVIKKAIQDLQEDKIIGVVFNDCSSVKKNGY